MGFVLALSKLLHDNKTLSSLFPEAGMIILVGMLAGYLINLLAPDREAVEGQDDDGADVAEGLLSFSPEIFFVALLPPIIFNSGYHLRRGE